MQTILNIHGIQFDDLLIHNALEYPAYISFHFYTFPLCLRAIHAGGMSVITSLIMIEVVALLTFHE